MDSIESEDSTDSMDSIDFITSIDSMQRAPLCVAIVLLFEFVSNSCFEMYGHVCLVCVPRTLDEFEDLIMFFLNSFSRIKAIRFMRLARFATAGLQSKASLPLILLSLHVLRCPVGVESHTACPSLIRNVFHLV